MLCLEHDRDLSSAMSDPVWNLVLREGLAWWIESPGATAAWFTHPQQSLPLTVSATRAEPTPPWSTSARTMFGDMAIEEGARQPSVVARGLTQAAAPLVRMLARGLDPVVQIGSYGMSTYLHRVDAPDAFIAAAAAVRAQWPDHIPVVRSLDTVQSPHTLAALRNAGWTLVPARQVWYSDPHDSAMWRKRDTHEDQKLLQRTPLTRRDLAPSDAEVLVALYNQLYIGKYSRFNPRVRVPAVAALLESGGLSGEAFVEGDRMLSAYAAFTTSSQMTATMVGYELNEPSSRGLYRLAVAASLVRARERGLRLHMSAGADRFKQLRGAHPVVEYLAVDLRSATAPGARSWRRLARITTSLAPRIFRDAFAPHLDAFVTG